MNYGARQEGETNMSKKKFRLFTTALVLGAGAAVLSYLYKHRKFSEEVDRDFTDVLDSAGEVKDSAVRSYSRLKNSRTSKDFQEAAKDIGGAAKNLAIDTKNLAVDAGKDAYKAVRDALDTKFGSDLDIIKEIDDDDFDDDDDVTVEFYDAGPAEGTENAKDGMPSDRPDDRSVGETNKGQADARSGDDRADAESSVSGNLNSGMTASDSREAAGNVDVSGGGGTEVSNDAPAGEGAAASNHAPGGEGVTASEDAPGDGSGGGSQDDIGSGGSVVSDKASESGAGGIMRSAISTAERMAEAAGEAVHGTGGMAERARKSAGDLASAAMGISSEALGAAAQAGKSLEMVEKALGLRHSSEEEGRDRSGGGGPFVQVDTGDPD